MSPRPLPPRLTRLLARLVPADRRGEVLGDLAEEYARAQRRGRRAASTAWLSREAASLAIAWMGRALARAWRARIVLLRDGQYAMRSLARQPVAACGAALMLAAGLTAVMLTQALTAALLARPVSAAHGDALRRVAAHDAAGRTITRMSLIDLHELELHLAPAARLTSVALEPVLVRVGPTRTQTLAEIVGPGYFTLMGIPARLGRTLLDVDHRAGAEPAAIISSVLWREAFGSDPAAVGATLDLNGRPFTVAGVAAPGVTSSFLGGSVDVWVSHAHGDGFLNRGWRTNAADRPFSLFVLPERADAELIERLASAGRELARQQPDPWRDRRPILLPGTALLGSQQRVATVLARILAALAALMLAVAATNVGGVMLARAAADRRTAAIHIAIGAGASAPVRRRLFEGVIIGLGGAVLAVLGYALLRPRLADITLLPTLSLRLDLPLDLGVLRVAAGAGIAAGLLLAAGPAWWTARLDVAAGLGSGGRGAAGDHHVARMRQWLVTAEVACSFVLLAGAGLFARSLEALTIADIGVPRDRLVAMDFDIEPGAPDGTTTEALARLALQRATALPGVAAAAMSNRAPVDSSTPVMEVEAPGVAGAAVEATFNLVTSRYFETVGIPLLAGRAFADAEGSASDVAIVNESLARRLWAGQDPLGRGLRLPTRNRTVRIVGVARDAHYRSIAESHQPHMYLPVEPRFGLAMLIRTTSDPRLILKMAQDSFDAIGPGVIGFFPRTMDDHLAIELLPSRAASAAATWLGALALVLSAIGLYGLVSWFVYQREREIGIRLALGAGAHHIRRMVIVEGLRTAAPGLVIGLGLAMAFALTVRTTLFGVRPLDPAVLMAAGGLLLVTVAAASWAPARRAAGADPAATLRP